MPMVQHEPKIVVRMSERHVSECHIHTYLKQTIINFMQHCLPLLAEVI